MNNKNEIDEILEEFKEDIEQLNERIEELENRKETEKNVWDFLNENWLWIIIAIWLFWK